MNPIHRLLAGLTFLLALFVLPAVRGAGVTATYTSATDVPVTAAGYTASGDTVNFNLLFAPAPGTALTVVRNTSQDFISGTFGNLAQGQTVALSYSGLTYHFVANYFGGSGNDLVLQWAGTRVFDWGKNNYGQLGNNSTMDSRVPMAVTTTGVLAGKIVIAVAAGSGHSLALCSDGSVGSWGSNPNGQLGNNSTTGSSVPVAVATTGVLAGKTVIAVAVGLYHSLALCSDGSVAAWGWNGYGQLGNNSTTDSSVPVAVATTGVLAGKTVIAIAAGVHHNLVLCSDGSVAAWGSNSSGQLGNNSKTDSSVPVAVTTTGVLAGKTVIAVAAGGYHNLVLCSDGSVSAWGFNPNGQLGNKSTTDSSVPVAVDTTGVLAGKTVIAVASGGHHNLALCSDGSVAAWGFNLNGQLGNNSMTDRSVPVAVTTIGVLAGKTVIGVAAGYGHSLALCSDGRVAAWGFNLNGQLGNNNMQDSSVPVTVSTTPLPAGARFVGIAPGPTAFHSVALVAAVQSPIVTGVAPSTGSRAGGTIVTLTGTDFTGATGVTIGGIAATGVSVVNATTITATTPAHDEGVVSVVVTTPSGSNAANTLYTFVKPAPTITPSTANLRKSAMTLTITGTNFSPTWWQNTVAFTPAGTGLVTASTETTLTVTSLTGHSLGVLNAVVTTNGASSGAPVPVATVFQLVGDVDPLNAEVDGGSSSLALVEVSVVQPDGKTIIAGEFTSVQGVARNNIARLHADGTVDMGFNPNADDRVLSVAVEADGRILLGGWFRSVGGTARNGIARVDAAGVVDVGFNPVTNGQINSVALQTDGRILLGGWFTSVGGTARNRIARVDAAGLLDPGFNPDADNTVISVTEQADGRILLGGVFTTVGGTVRNNIARVDAAGLLDPGFDPNANDAVVSVAVQADGRILLGGYFTTVGGIARNRIARVDAAGVIDPGFNPNANDAVSSVAVQADGRILLGGYFTTVGGTVRNHIVRVNAAGVVDAGFNPNANGAVYSVAVEADGRILLGGSFPSVGGTARNLFARLVNDPATQTLSAPDATQVTWSRGGSSPEVSQVTFEKSTDSGATWIPLGTGTRIGSTPNWQLNGLSLPTTGQLRARGRTTGGFYNGSSGLIEQVAAFTFYTPFQQWKLTHLGDANAPDDGDPDFDGLPTILEYATGGDPDVAGPLPVASSVEGRLAITFPRNTAATDVSFTVQGSDDLSTWTDLARSTAGAPMVALDVGVNVVETGAGVLRAVEVCDLFLTTDPAHPRRYLRLRELP